MNILKTTQNTALAAFQSVSGIVERRHTVPILANVLMKKSGNALQLITSDLEIQMRTTAELGGDVGDFETTVGVRKLLDILKNIPVDQTVTLDSSDGKIVLKGGKSRFTLQSLPAQDFPLVQEAADFGSSFSLSQKIIKDLMGRISFAMAVQDIRYYLNGILFSVQGNQLSLVATDGHRLAWTRATLDIDVGEKQEVILPRKTVVELQKLLSDTSGDNAPRIQIQFASNQARLNFGTMELVTKLVEGKFPDYNRVIPQNHNHVIILGRLPLLSALQRAAIMTSDKFKGIRLYLEPGVLRVVSTNSEQEEAQDELDIDYQGSNIEIGFNVTYLIEALNTIGSEMIELHVQDGNSSAMITVPNDEDFKYVVMPMRM